MPAITPIQDSFAAGELTPRLYRRSDVGAYSNGTRTLKNFIPVARGPAKNRDGFRYLGSVRAFPGEVVIVQTARVTITTPAVDVQIT